jgi:hypothetical protein
MGKNGILVPLKTRELRSAADISDAHLPIVVSVIDDIHAKRHRASEAALCADERLIRAIGHPKKLRPILNLMEASGYIEFTGTTKDRDGSVTTEGRDAAMGTNRNKSPDFSQ